MLSDEALSDLLARGEAERRLFAEMDARSGEQGVLPAR